MKSKTTTIRQKVTINAPPEKVYNAYTDPEVHSSFTGAKATNVARAGGKMTAWDNYITAKNLKLVKGRRIVQEWKDADWPEGYPPSILDIRLKKKGNGTELLMVQSNIPTSVAKAHESGWKEFYWNPMNKYFARHK